MSCSVFKEFPESNDNHLVVVINKNGNVSVDQSELHDFLGIHNFCLLFWIFGCYINPN